MSRTEARDRRFVGSRKPLLCLRHSDSRAIGATPAAPADPLPLLIRYPLSVATSGPYNNRMPKRTLTALPVYNEVDHVAAVVDGALNYSKDVLVVDDGSSDGTADVLAKRSDIHLVTHPQNIGYGRAVRSAFDFAARNHYDVLVTIDCDGQHQPQMIPRFVEMTDEADIVSGSRYLRKFPGDSNPPPERFRINRIMTAELNRRLGLELTDAFCGFKAYRVPIFAQFRLTEDGYAMPLEFWVQAVRLRLSIVEAAVPLIYLDESRSFGGAMDRSDTRLAVYQSVLERAIADADQWERTA